LRSRIGALMSVTPTTSWLSAIRKPAAAMAFRAESESAPSRKARMTWPEVEAEAAGDSPA
jgi:hypothetical protein